MIQWYKHKPESVIESETQKILWDFEIQTNYKIPTGRLDFVSINMEKIWHLVDFAVPGNNSFKKEKKSEKIDIYLNIAKGLLKLWKMKVTVIPIVVGNLGTFPKSQEKGSGGSEDQKKNPD